MLTPRQIKERAEAITARLRYVVDSAGNPAASGIYTLPSTGKVLNFGKQKNGWKLSRLLYRVGELNVTEALEPLLTARPLLREDFDFHAFVRTLGIIGNDTHVPTLREILVEKVASPIVRRATIQSILQLSGESEAAGIELPKEFTDVTTADDLAEKLRGATRENRVNSWLYPLYLHLKTSSSQLLPIFRDHLKTLPHRGNYFQPLRYTFKAAEQFEDHATVATLFHWMWRAEPESVVRKHYDYKQVDGRWQSIHKGSSASHPEEHYDWHNPTTTAAMSQRQNTKWGFTRPTRHYLLHRVYRTLAENGASRNAAAYTDLATDILLALNGEAVRPEYAETLGRYDYDESTRRYTYVRYQLYYPEAANLVPVQWIVNGGKGGYDVNPSRAVVSSRKRLATLTGRRERYPELWNERPRPVIRLLAESTLPPVQDFAVRIFRGNPEFANTVSSADLLKMLGGTSEDIVALALDTLRNRPELLDGPIGYALIVHNRKDLRDWAASNVRTDFATIFDNLLTETDAARFELGLAWLERHHAKELGGLTDEHLSTLARHPITAAGLLVARLLRDRRPLPYALILQLMTSEHAEVRAAGIELFGALPVAELYRHHRETIVGMCVSEREEVRASAAPIARVLAEHYPDFAEELVTTLVAFLQMRGKATETHAAIGDLLCVPPVRSYLGNLPEDEIWALLRSKKFPAQRVGFTALRDRKTDGALTTAELVELGRHDWTDAREFAREQLTTNAERTVYEVMDFLPLLDTGWADSADFARQFLRDRMSDRDWTPEVLIALLDIPREEVQTFALPFVERHVTAGDATEFLLRASQHPGRHVQEFAAGWLERYATGKPAVIEALLPFFRTLLGQISRGRAAKDRVFDFLAAESAKDESTARLTVPLLQRLMLTIATGDKARCLVILNELRRRYPHLDSPLRVTKLNTPEPQNKH